MELQTQSPNDLFSGWLRTGGLLQGALVRDFVAQDTLALTAGTRIGVWRIVEEIGRGGMGVVFRAERADGAYHQEIALKLVDGKMVRPEQRALFVRERQLLAELEHPGIARLLDGGELPTGQPWFALELVRGERIDDYVRSRVLPLAARLDLLIQVGDAIAYAHRRLVIHRDLKPANVLVDADGRVRLLDFGISGIVRETGSGVAGLGTQSYASPEQQAGAAPGTGDDVYALGRLLQRLAGDGAPADLCSIVDKATAPSVEARQASVVSLVEDLQAYRSGRPVAAHAGGPTYRLRKRIQRHPLASLATVLAIAALAITIGALLQQRGAARDAAARAQAINRFLNDDVLTNANPLLSGDAHLSMRAALDRAAATIDTRFADSPAVREEIELTLARSYDGLGVYDIAEQHARRAAELNVQRAGTHGPETWAVRALLADLAGEREPLETADPAFAGLLAEIAAAGQLESPRGVDVAYDRIRTQARATRTEWVIAAAEELLPRARRVYGDASAAVASIETTLANSYAFANRLDEAESLLRARLAKPAGSDPATPLTILHVQQELAYVLRQRGNSTDALKLQNTVVEEFTRLLGRGHPDTQTALNEVAGMLQDAKRGDEAAPLFREVLELRLKLDGEENYKTRTSMNNLGMLLSTQGQLDEAGRWLARVHELELRLSGADARETLQAAHNLAGLRRKQGDYATAVALQEDVVARAGKAFGEDRPEPAMLRYGYALSLIAAQQFDKATIQLSTARDDLQRTLGAEHQRTRTANERLAELQRDPAAARARVIAPVR
ncbi:MAG: serine/threonine-protein kinase [Tahibacter sp.]